MPEELSRRHFLKNLSGMAIGCSLLACQKKPDRAVQKGGPINLGQVKNLKPGINEFRLERLGVIREGQKLRAISLVCTHQTCVVRPQGSMLVCPCHGSEFSLDGRVKKGPAERDIPSYQIEISGLGDVVVNTGLLVDPGISFEIPES